MAFIFIVKPHGRDPWEKETRWQYNRPIRMDISEIINHCKRTELK
jgi:hypothetical protein